MENNTLSKYTTSFGLSLALSSLVNAILVIAKEKCPAVQAAMKKWTGHHWITHVAIVLLVFLLFGWLLARPNGGKGVAMTAGNLLKTLVSGVIVAGLIIVAFYLISD